MYLNKAALTEHMKREFGGNYRKFAKALGVEVSQLHRIINADSQAGVVFLGRLHKYCAMHDYKFESFIFFNQGVHCS